VFVLAVWRFGPKLSCTSSPCEDLDRSWRVRPRRVKIWTEVDVYVLAVWRFGPKLTCSSLPCADLDQFWRVRPLRVKIWTKVDVLVLTVWRFRPKLTCTSSPCEDLDQSWRVRHRLVKISTVPQTVRAFLTLTFPKLRTLGRCSTIRWNTLQVSTAYSCNRKFPGDYENKVNILFPGTVPIVEFTPLGPYSRLMKHQFQLSARLHSCWKSKTCNLQ
jgi:hypothetical protein